MFAQMQVFLSKKNTQLYNQSWAPSVFVCPDVTLATSGRSKCYIALSQRKRRFPNPIPSFSIPPLYRSFFEASIGRKLRHLQMIKFTVYRRPNLSSVEDPIILPIKVGWLQEFTKTISIPQQPLTFSTFYTLSTVLIFNS